MFKWEFTYEKNTQASFEVHFITISPSQPINTPSLTSHSDAQTTYKSQLHPQQDGRRGQQLETSWTHSRQQAQLWSTHQWHPGEVPAKIYSTLTVSSHFPEANLWDMKDKDHKGLQLLIIFGLICGLFSINKLIVWFVKAQKIVRNIQWQWYSAHYDKPLKCKVPK